MPLPGKKETPRDLDFTGERFLPGRTDPILALEHYHRYYFASGLAHGKRTVDFACGEGYGSAMLAAGAAEVLGIDCDPAAIEHARSRYGSLPNLSFEIGRCEESPKEERAFDLAIAFELLEHLDAPAQADFLSNVKRVLKQDGLFLISSPEKTAYAETNSSGNEFHKHELSLAEFESLLNSSFRHVQICAQRVMFLSAMWRPEHSWDAQFRFHQRKNLLEDLPDDKPLAEPLYLIALCSDVPIPGDILEECNSLYFDASSSDQTKSFTGWARELNEEARRNREVIRDLQQRIEERTAWAMNLDGQMKGKDELIGTLKNELIEMVRGELEKRAKWAYSLEHELKREREISSEARTKLSIVTSPRLYRLLARIGFLPRP